MTLDPILSAPLAVQFHLLAAIPALLLGPVALWRSRRDRWHRITGYVWVASMAAVAATGLAIPSAGLALVSPLGLGPFGPIHLLSLATFWGIACGVSHARAGRTAAHRATMRWMYFGALGLAGLFTLLPGRRLNAALFPAEPGLGWLAIAAGLGFIAALWSGRAGMVKLALPFTRTTR